MLSLRKRRKKRRRQQDALTSISGGPARRRLPGLGNGGSDSRPSRQTRSKRDRTFSRDEARQARANTIIDRDISSPTVKKPPALRRQNASRDISKAKVKDGKPKFDISKGRMVYPADRGGTTVYLPIHNEASDRERDSGAFINDDAIRKEPANSLAEARDADPLTIRDVATGRTLFATITANKDGKDVTEYLPKQGEATALELSEGKYVRKNDVEQDSIATEVSNKRPKYDFGQQRDLFAVKTADGDTRYVPKKDDATAEELAAGFYVEDEDISHKAPLGAANAIGNAAPKFDISKNRKLYQVTVDGKKRYLPKESDASDREKLSGYFIPDKVVEDHESKRRRTALKDDTADQAQRRAQRAIKLAGGVSRRPKETSSRWVREAKDGTELWDGSSLPEVSPKKQRETLKKLRPRYDLGKGRMVYPTEMANGKIAYLPLARDASPLEKTHGLYAALVPLEPLDKFLQRQDIAADIAPQQFDTDEGAVQAYALMDIEAAFEKAPQLVLRAAQFASDVAQETSELQQQFVEA